MKNPVREYECPSNIIITFTNLHTNSSRGDYSYFYKRKTNPVRE
jgi:hypothetical protein